MEYKKIELQNFRGINSSVFTGRPQGMGAREHLGLDKVDKGNDGIEFIVPAGTSAITPSFFLGLLYNSIKKLRIENYRLKYRFSFLDENAEVVKILKDNIEEGERHAFNSLTQKRGVDRFIQ